MKTIKDQLAYIREMNIKNKKLNSPMVIPQRLQGVLNAYLRGDHSILIMVGRDDRITFIQDMAELGFTNLENHFTGGVLVIFDELAYQEHVVQAELSNHEKNVRKRLEQKRKPIVTKKKEPVEKKIEKKPEPEKTRTIVADDIDWDNPFADEFEALPKKKRKKNKQVNKNGIPRM